ncbi:MAG: molybdopterin-dependent oxidoreductase [Rhodospirillales bacterium]|nr:molybdopterin-dependent oxidoreductase [Rhodospirillales bacterium]
MHASWSIVPDFNMCNYAIYFGASKGHSAGHASCSNMGLAAEARARGMKMVVVDPFCHFAAAKANRWVPIRVGTDAALALAMANFLVNELGTVDEHYLKSKTNAPYLIGPDKHYVRDPDSGKPLVWDDGAGAAAAFDDCRPEAMALTGSFEVNGTPCRPSFALLKEHLKQFTPERGEEVSTVPAADIRSLARDFAAEARIGSTIVIDGVEIPYRPAAAIAFRGSQGHVNSVYNFLAIDLLNHLVGSADMAGGCLGFNPACHGYAETGKLRYAPSPDADGLMITGSWMSGHDPYPTHKPKAPNRLGLQDLFSMAQSSPYLYSSDNEEVWEKLNMPYRIEMAINAGANLIMSVGNKEAAATALAKIGYMVSFDLFLTETSAFCDIVLPDCDHLQSLDSRSNFPFIFSLPGGMGEWCWPIRQPATEPVGGQRQYAEMLMELAHRAGFGGDYNMAYNAALGLEGTSRLKAEKRYTYEQICDADLKNTFGEAKGLEWFKENGILKWPKKPEEVYWRHFIDVRVPIYWEWMPKLYEDKMAVLGPAGLSLPREYFDPLPDWLPCNSHECDKEDFDFYAFYYRDVIHSNSLTMENAWLDETAQMDPFSYNIAINREVGEGKGFSSGDLVWVENEGGRKVKGKLRLTDAIHPEGLGIGACAGHWVDKMPVAKGKGVFFNDLLESDMEHSSPANLSLDICVKVKIRKADNA